MHQRSTTTDDSVPFATKAHIRYALRSLRMLPSAYQSDDNSRLTFGFFAVGALSLLGALDRLDRKEKDDYLNWILRRWDAHLGGFTGQPSVDLRDHDSPSDCLDQPHITHTYSGLLTLGLLYTPQPDDPTPINPYKSIDISKLLDFIAGCQKPNGSFAPFPSSTEQDVRFVYCAAAILKTVNVDPNRVIDAQLTVDFLASCRAYDGGYGQAPHLESQGGTTYCALAALSLLDRLEDSLSAEDALETVKWLVDRQTAHVDLPEDSDNESEILSNELASDLGRSETDSKPVVPDDQPGIQLPSVELLVAGFQGRPGKALDACYSFWCTAALNIVQKHSVFSASSLMAASSHPALFRVAPLYHDPLANIRFLMCCQSTQWGGIARFPQDLPDLYHNYLALGSISLSNALASHNAENPLDHPKDFGNTKGQNNLAAHDPCLNIPINTVRWIKKCFS